MELTDAVAYLNADLIRLRALNDQKAPTRSRELSLAITNIETGLLWLREAASKEVPF